MTTKPLNKARVVEALKNSRISHYTCEDSWYSCQKSEDGCCNDSTQKDECTCGADDHNKIIDEALASLPEPMTNDEIFKLMNDAAPEASFGVIRDIMVALKAANVLYCKELR